MLFDKAKKKKHKRGNQQLMGLAVGVIVVVVIVLVLAIGTKITSDIQGTLTGSAADAAANGTLALTGIASWLPTVGTILVASVLIGLLMWGFFSLFNRKGGM